MEDKKKKLIVVQRVLTKYRYDLLKELSPYYKELIFITSEGSDEGTLKRYDPKENKYNNIRIKVYKSLRFGFKGDSRNSSLFFYPQALREILNADILLIEGTTNFINNLWIIPFARLFRKKTIWWDAGYSLEVRTRKRKIIDFLSGLLIRYTDIQIAYSTKAKLYMEQFMSAKNCHLLLNTINTEYFESIKGEVEQNIKNKKFDRNQVRLLYVGVLEHRKKVKELIEIVQNLNQIHNSRVYSLDVIGGGIQLDELRIKFCEDCNIKIHGPIYDHNQLRDYYFKSDLFVLPGDGGLGILQSLLYGLPVVCCAADGTEDDYIEDTSLILKSIYSIEELLVKIESVMPVSISSIEKLYSSNWINKFNMCINDKA